MKRVYGFRDSKDAAMNISNNNCCCLSLRFLLSAFKTTTIIVAHIHCCF